MRYEIKIHSSDILWYKNNKFHRLYGPALEYKHYFKSWFKNGNRHRSDGPALEWLGGSSKAWFIDDKQYSEEEFLQILPNVFAIEGII